MHSLTIIVSHPQALVEAVKILATFDRNQVRLVSSPVLKDRGLAQVHVTAEGAILRDVVDTLDRAGFL